MTQSDAPRFFTVPEGAVWLCRRTTAGWPNMAGCSPPRIGLQSGFLTGDPPPFEENRLGKVSKASRKVQNGYYFWG